MKPRVLIAGQSYRIVQISPGGFSVEKYKGKDAMRVPQWELVGRQNGEHWYDLVRDLGRSLSIRRKRAARRRRSRA